MPLICLEHSVCEPLEWGVLYYVIMDGAMFAVVVSLAFLAVGTITFTYWYALKGYRQMYIAGSSQQRFLCCICNQEQTVGPLDGSIPTKYLKNSAAFLYETIVHRKEPPLHELVCSSCQTSQMAEKFTHGYFPALGLIKKNGQAHNLDKRLSAHRKLKNEVYKTVLLMIGVFAGITIYILIVFAINPPE